MEKLTLRLQQAVTAISPRCGFLGELGGNSPGQLACRTFVWGPWPCTTNVFEIDCIEVGQASSFIELCKFWTCIPSWLFCFAASGQIKGVATLHYGPLSSWSSSLELHGFRAFRAACPSSSEAAIPRYFGSFLQEGVDAQGRKSSFLRRVLVGFSHPDCKSQGAVI